MRYIYINGKAYYVKDEIFYAMRKSLRRERYLHEQDMTNKNISFEEISDILIADNSPEAEYEFTELSRLLWKALRTLDKDDFDFITRLFFEQATTAELTHEFGINTRSVYYRRDKILRKLRRYLEKMSE